MTPSARALFFLMLGGLLLAGCRQPPPAEEPPPVAPVKAEPAKFGVFGEWTELIGTTQPLPGHLARVTAPVEGHVVSVLKDEKGQPVAEGQTVAGEQVIVKLDDRVARAQRDKVAAMLAELTETRKQADLAYQAASVTLDSLTKLNPSGTSESSLPLVSKIEIEKARIALQDAESKQRGVNAKEKTLKSELKALDVQLELYQLRAPIAGVLGPLQVVPGQTLAIGTAVADVTDLSEVDVVVFAPPRAARKLQLKQSVWLAGKNGTEADREGPEGKVAFIAIGAQPDTGNFQVKLRFPNQKLQLRANQVARALVLTQPEAKRLTIPDAALMEDTDPPQVVVAKDVKVKKGEHGDEHIGEAKRLRARVGIRDRAHHVVEILGLEDPTSKEAVPVQGTLFVVSGGHGLHDGDLVKVAQQQH
jgi:multidrug efflux pump subunit AcrA (membrane-fusion protein)